jgi:PAS domain-containing protein
MAPNFQIEIESLPVDRSAGFHQKVVDGIEDLLLVLAEDGRVLYASPKSLSLIQINPEALVGHYISTYMNVDDIPVFLMEWKENMALGSTWRTHHRLRQKDDTYKPFESTFKPYTDNVVDKETGSKTSTKLCLMTSRPYQITSTTLMDSFLEHYTTNIRLSNQLAQLKGEAEEFYESTMSKQNADTTMQCATFKLEATTTTKTATTATATGTTTTTVSVSRT